MKKKIVSLVLALMLCLSCVSALAAEAWTVTCPWAPSGVAAMVNQKAASLSTTYSQDYVLVANAEKGDTATINSWLTKYTEADPQMCFIGEGMFGITAILDPERMNFTYDDFEYVENLYSSIFVASARKELGLTSIDALKTTVREDYKFSTDELNHLPYGEKKIVLVTCHRRENYGEPMKNIMLALRQIAEENPEVELVYPVHLSPVVREAVDKYLRGVDCIPTEDRMRVGRLIENMTGGTALVESMHGAGSPQAQKVMYSKLSSLEQKKKFAAAIAGVGHGEKKE